ncbi:MAG: hypothetical protein OEN50_03155 [Deltaproteobacteria bacterium]|nr:hypothetical protein [Deltaproteobacteria bacterium]
MSDPGLDEEADDELRSLRKAAGELEAATLMKDADYREKMRSAAVHAVMWGLLEGAQAHPNIKINRRMVSHAVLLLEAVQDAHLGG